MLDSLKQGALQKREDILNFPWPGLIEEQIKAFEFKHSLTKLGDLLILMFTNKSVF